ncbi:MAG: helix-turn-helix domain-containing protein [Lachnospiraceae bacterium]|nr:helix-turn-helix domain-containing protein [Lachnospiraceae bacterium]
MKLSSAWLYEQLAKEFTIVKAAGLSGRDGYLRPFFWSEVRSSRRGEKQQSEGNTDAWKDEKRQIEEGNTNAWKDKKRQDRGSMADRRGHVCVIPVLSEEDATKWSAADVQDPVFRVFCLEKGRCGKPKMESGGAYVCVEADGGAAEVLNYVQEMFDVCEEWEQKVVGLLAENAGIGKTLELSAGFLGNPLMVMGTDFSLTAEAGMEKLPEREKLFTRDGLNVEYMNALLQDEGYQKLTQERRTVLFPDYISGRRSMLRTLFVDQQPTYRLVLTEYDTPVTESCICILETLAKHLEYQLAREAPAPMKGDLEAIFQRVLSDRTADYVQISRSLSAVGWGGQDEYLCLVLQITYLNQKQLSTRAICCYVQKQLRDSVSFLYQDEVVSFFNLSRLGMDEEEAAAKLVYFIRDSYLKAGYSRTMKGHMNLRRQYVQAQTALDVGSRKRPYLWIHHFNQVALTYIIEQSTRKLPADMICHEGLLKLREHDRENHTEYMATLKTWIDRQMNATQAAKELYIHRSTFLYRMERIKEILHSDLENPEEVFYLELSYRLLEQDEEKNHGAGQSQ